ncbi:hypothetical protein [Cryobacterium lyxosi]|uniref:Uncharacterized protein n=1 Tax=Cryobacterium lyxosi TaxID=1259228 RepID=A0A4R8ZGA7_9MICO|nr:hypothetical protein [Cryobacterium lyxosi]TFD26641.1 hypothetical protein E3T27_07670 [Cryobacterium lyxosi]
MIQSLLIMTPGALGLPSSADSSIERALFFRAQTSVLTIPAGGVEGREMALTLMARAGAVPGIGIIFIDDGHADEPRWSRPTDLHSVTGVDMAGQWMLGWSLKWT